uniref:Interleukin-17N n=1 Tax=Xiphophorus maculatus TaxID=8083 RepID=M3ZQ68_XIPMA
MEKFQLCIFLLCLLILHQCVAMPLSNQCIGETLCTYTLKDSYSQMTNLPGDINTRSLATWVYQKKTDLNREPQVIYEARCQDSHSGGSCNSALGLETIPVTLRIPVLRKNSACFPLPSYSVEFENITVACICALARTQEEIAQG